MCLDKKGVGVIGQTIATTTDVLRFFSGAPQLETNRAGRTNDKRQRKMSVVLAEQGSFIKINKRVGIRDWLSSSVVAVVVVALHWRRCHSIHQVLPHTTSSPLTKRLSPRKEEDARLCGRLQRSHGPIRHSQKRRTKVYHTVMNDSGQRRDVHEQKS